MKQRWLLIGLCLIFFSLLLPNPHGAQAAAGCTLYVTSTADNTTGDTNLTLREAVLLANDGTTASGLNRGLTVGELAHLGTGCAWDAGRNLIQGGMGFVDTIYFSTTLGSGPIITLTAGLTLTDPGGDVLNGTYNAVTPTLNFNPALNQPGLTLLQNQVVKGIRIMRAAEAGIDIQGNDNQIVDVAIWNSWYGIYIRSNNNIIDGAFIGVKDATVTTCTGWGNATHGLVLYNGGLNVQYNVIKNSRIVCNGFGTPVPAIYLSGSGVTHNTLGPNNLIGTNVWGGGLNLGNKNDGLYITNGAASTDVVSNTFAYNLGNGVAITNTSFTRLGGNWIRYNTLDGVIISGTSQNTVIGGPSFNNTLTGNVIGHNGQQGVELQGSNVRYTLLAGNFIGALPGTGQSDDNTRNGVMVDGARNNFIGDTNALTNTIGGNRGSGIVLTNGASQNVVAKNVIGLATAPNNIAGVYLGSGAHDNVIGQPGNLIKYNTNATGVAIDGSTTATNTVINNTVQHNNIGIRLIEGAFNNTIGQVGADNIIAENINNGFEVLSGAHHNFINGNVVQSNGHNGLRLGSSATGNVISGTHFISNTRDGLSEASGLSGNSWSQVYFQANGGLPIDKNVLDETTDVVDAPPAQIRSRVAANSVITITGVATPASLFKSVQVEVYGYTLPGGKVTTTYLGRASVNYAGAWTLTVNSFAQPYRCLMAFETSTTNLLGQVTTSSEFGYSNCRNLLPVIVR